MLNSSKKPVMRPESEVQVPKYGFLRNSGGKVGIANAIVQVGAKPPLHSWSNGQVV